MKNRAKLLAILFGGMILLGTSCASLRDLRFDPTGSCIFTNSRSGVTPNTTGESSLVPAVSNPSATESLPSTESIVATDSTTQPNQFPNQQFPSGFGAAVPGTGMGSGFTGIAGTGYNYAESAPPDPVQGPAVILTPKVQFAPVNSEIVLVASFLGNDEYLRTNQPIEWSLDGVGSILSYDTGSWCDWTKLDFSNAKKVNDRFVRTKTSANLWTIDRGTTDTKDDVQILKGQTWITLKSTREGSTYITAMSPAINDWNKRSAGSTIHWVDAQYAFPRSSSSSVGDQRQLTTIVSRQSNNSPRPGWFVEYEIIGGPAAGFGESLAQRTKVQTDSAGRADVMLSLKDKTAGTSTIAVRVIRPSPSETNEGELVVGSTTVRQIWSTSTIFSYRLTPPENPMAGRDSIWNIWVKNQSNRTAGALVRVMLPHGLNYVSSNYQPVPRRISTVLEWEFDFPAQGDFNLNLNLRPDPTVVGTGRNMRVNVDVFERPRSETQSQPPPTPIAPDLQPESRPQPPAPVNPPPSTSSGEVNVNTPYLTVSRDQEDGNFKLYPSSNTMKVGERKWTFFQYTNTGTDTLSEISIVYYPPESGNALSNSLKYLNRLTSEENRESGFIRYVWSYKDLKPGETTGPYPCAVELEAVRPGADINIFYDVYAKKSRYDKFQLLGRYRLPVVVER